MVAAVVVVIVTGLLSLPALLFLLLVSVPIVALLSLPAAYLLCYRKQQQQPRTKSSSSPPSKGADDDNTNAAVVGSGNGNGAGNDGGGIGGAGGGGGGVHVIVTGGSSGIGLAIACESAKKAKAAADAGSGVVRKITIIARNEQRLQTAKEVVTLAAASADASSDNQQKVQVQALSIDVTNPEALKEAASNVFGVTATVAADKVEEDETTTTTTLLFCCAGEPLPAYFEDVPPSMFAQLAATNQLGCMYTVQAFLPFMARGTVSLCSSACGQIGVFGYSAYAPTKFALRGFAECLHMELGDRPIHVQVAYPPDTETPGYEKENVGKPRETRLISEVGGLAQPESVGRTMLESALRKQPPFSVYFDFEGFMLSTLSAGFSPVLTWGDAVAQLCGLMTVFRWVALFLLQDWCAIVRRCRAEKNNPSDDDGNKNNNNDKTASAEGGGVRKED